MRPRKYYKTNRRYKKGGRGVPYTYNNRIYFRKKPQKRTGVVLKVLAHLLLYVGNIIGL